MSKSTPRVPIIPAAEPSLKPRRPRFSESFKCDAVRLVTHEGYTFKAAAQAVGVSSKSLRDWHKQRTPAPQPCGSDASVDQLQDELSRLRRQLRRAEMEREILKKATAYFAKESS